MNLLILIIMVILYLGLVGWLGWLGYRKTTSTLDYMVGGRNIHPYVLAMSYGATFISTSAIVGFGGVAAMFGMSLLWLPFFNILVGILIAFAVFGRRTRRMGVNLDAHTFPELLGRRLDSPFIQRFGGLVIFIFMPLYAAAVLIGASRIVEGLTGLPYIYSVVLFSLLVAVYVILGGIKGVMYTDALQGSLMFFGMLFLFFFIYQKLGGVTVAHQKLTALAPLVPDSLAAIGHQGWTASPVLGSPLWWIVYSTLVLGVGIGVLAQPQLVVRYMTVKSDRELNRAISIGAVFILATVGTAFLVGSLTNVYFQETAGKLAIEYVGGNSDKIIPAFIADALPSWFGYLFMLVIISAGMSTLSSQFHTIGTSIGRDFFALGKSDGGDKARELLITRGGIFLTILASAVLSLILPGGIIARATAIFFGLMASAFLAPYGAALYWKGLTKTGAIAGILTGFGSACLLFLFFHTKESSALGVCQALFGKATLSSGIGGFIDPLVFALPLSAVTTVVVSLLTKKMDPEKVSRSFGGIGVSEKEESPVVV